MSSETSSASTRPPRKDGSLMLHHGLTSACLGLPLSIWLSGLLYHLTGSQGDPAKYQVAMWSVVPLWTAIICFSFLAGSRRVLWFSLLAANLAAGALVHLVAR